KRGYRLVAPVSSPGAEFKRKTSTGHVAFAPRRTGFWVGVGALSVLVIVLTSVTIFPELGLWWTPVESPGTEITPNSIAVLPFDNLSGDPSQEYFADGMTDDLITGLAKNPDLFVIARDSTFFYKGRPTDIQSIAEKLKVRYFLRGSIRRAGEDVHINTQLIDTETGSHLWAERYDGQMDDVFGMQNNVIRNILATLKKRTAIEVQAGNQQQETRNPDAYDYFLHGRNRFFQFANKEDNRKARELYRKAIDLDPDFAMAYAMLAWTHAFEAMNGWSEERDASLSHAHALATHAISLDEALPVAYFVTGLVYRERGEYVKALVEAEKAIALDPNYANAHVLLATLLYYAGRPQEGLYKIKKAMKLNPYYPYNYPFHLGQAYFILGKYPEAIEALEQGLGSNPSSERMRVWLAAAYAQSGREDDARWEAEQVLTLNPDFSLERIRQAFPFKDPADIARFLDGLRIAGITQ
ncbi:MAG: tetratricopeptide repeat protein, partial [Gammaproteobacteria bacterium]